MHFVLLRKLFAPRSLSPTPPGRAARRATRTQLERRGLERQVKRGAVAFSRWVGRCGYDVAQAAAFLGISPHTLDHWRDRAREDRLKIRLRGRPLLELPRQIREAFLTIFGFVAPVADLGFFRGVFPDVPYNALVRLYNRCHVAWHRRRIQVVSTLKWLKPGTVWAMDFTEPPVPVDGEFPWVLLVTDLATGRVLHTQPCRSASADLTRDVLTMLFQAHGPPMVIKCDNGSAFIAAALQPLLEVHDVVLFFSPPGTPSFNGSCEARVGSVNTRTFLESARHGRPGAWTSDDLEAARCQINATRDHDGGPTPDDVWRERYPLHPSDRQLFLERYVAAELDGRTRRCIDPYAKLSHYDQAAVDRVAIAQVLLDLGYLEIGRRRIALPISRRSKGRIR